MIVNFDKDQDIKDDCNIEFDIVEKDFNDIISEIDFKTEEDKILCESIIDHIEHNIANGLKEMKIVQLPYIGTLRIDPIKKQIKENKDVFKVARHNMTKHEYKEYVKGYVNDIREKQEQKDSNKLILRKIRINNKKRYEKYYKTLGKSYAEAFIYCISIMTYVPYDKEFDEYYKSLKD